MPAKLKVITGNKVFADHNLKFSTHELADEHLKKLLNNKYQPNPDNIKLSLTDKNKIITRLNSKSFKFVKEKVHENGIYKHYQCGKCNKYKLIHLISTMNKNNGSCFTCMTNIYRKRKHEEFLKYTTKKNKLVLQKKIEKIKDSNFDIERMVKKVNTAFERNNGALIKTLLNSNIEMKVQCKNCKKKLFVYFFKSKRNGNGIAQTRCYDCYTKLKKPQDSLYYYQKKKEKHMCKVCNLFWVSSDRLKQNLPCTSCETGEKRIKKEEERFLKLLKDWNYPPSHYDEVIKGQNCKADRIENNKLNLRRMDYFYYCAPLLGYNVLLECDEYSHQQYEVECEMSRLQDCLKQVINATGNINPLVVIRFNPNCKDKQKVESELREKLRWVFDKKSKIKVDDDRGIKVVAILGYTYARLRKYKMSGLLQTHKI